MQAETIALALGGRHTGSYWIAPCPAHEDTDPSLSIRDADDGMVLLRCHAGCDQSIVIGELRSRGLWTDVDFTAVFGSGSETAPDKFTPCPTPSPAPTLGEHRRGSGNRCGHDPKHPNFAPPNPKRPKFIQKAIEKIYTAYTNLSVFPMLNFHIQGFKIRSERREACIKVLAVVLERMDLATLRVGFPTENGFLNYTLAYLAAHTGMGLRRVARAVHDLKKMGFLVISQIRERLQDGSYRSFSAVKTLSTTLFNTLGLRGWLDKERAKARERLRKKEKAYEKACAKSGRAVQRMTPQMSPARNAGVKAQDSQIIRTITGDRHVDLVSKYLAKLTPKARALILQLVVDIKMEHPDWSRESIYEEADRLLPGIYHSPQSVPA